MYNNPRHATTHKAVEMFFKFIVVRFLDDTVRSRRIFLTMVNSLRLKNRNGGKYMAKTIVNITVGRIFISLPEIKYMTVVGASNIARKVNSLRLVTDVR